MGHTPLFWAARGGHSEMVTLLLSKGAYINAQDKKEVTRESLLVISQPALPNLVNMSTLETQTQ